MRVRRAVRDRSAAQSTSRGRKEAKPRRRERSERSCQRRGCSRSAAIAGTVGDGSDRSLSAKGRTGGVRAGDRSAAKRRRSGRSDSRAFRGPRYVLRPDASGRVARFPRAPGHADPAEGAERPEPQGDQRERGRRPAARPKAQRRPQVRRRLRRARLPCRAQRRAGALHGGRPIPQPRDGRRRARCPPPSARATAPRRPSARPDRYLTAGRALADDAPAAAVERRASLPTATPGRGSRRRVSSAGATCAAGALRTLQPG